MPPEAFSRKDKEGDGSEGAERAYKDSESDSTIQLDNSSARRTKSATFDHEWPEGGRHVDHRLVVGSRQCIQHPKEKIQNWFDRKRPMAGQNRVET